MTQFERRLQNTNSYNSILLMTPTKKDKLSEDEVIFLKAKYLGASIQSVKFNVEKMSLYKPSFHKRLLKRIIRIYNRLVI